MENFSAPIDFHPLGLADGEMIRRQVYDTECRNCDLNFLNLVSWRFLYDTEVALWNGWLLFRFFSEGRRAYLAPIGQGDWKEPVMALRRDAASQGVPFFLAGVCENSLARLNEAMPGFFKAEADRRFTDYIYRRDVLSELAGKKLQPKRNLVNRFLRTYPNHEYLPLTPELIPECLELERRWNSERMENKGQAESIEERRSIETVFEHWDALGAIGGVVRVDGKLVAFTYGSPINYDTFGICVEKADVSYEGAYAFINREFARRIDPSFIYLNREDDLGIEGLRQVKLSYQPEVLLHKYHVVAKV